MNCMDFNRSRTLFGHALMGRSTAQGRTPLHLAALEAHTSLDHLQCLYLLAELGGAELGSAADDDGCTALHVAAEKGARQTASILIHTGVKIDCADHDGMTPLQLGARHGQLGVVQALIKAGAVLSHVDFDGTTALAHASAEGHVHIVEALLEAGADPLASDLLSASPLKLAIRHGHLAVSSVLIRQEQQVDLRACGVHSYEWLACLCSNAQAAMSMNLSAKAIDDQGAVGILSAAAVSMTKLVVLDLSRNEIKRTPLEALDPHILSALSRLSSLNLAQNLLVELHSNISALHGLVSLDVSNNALSTLPVQMVHCTALQRLSCSHNRIRTLPDALCQLTTLVVLDVSHNLLVRLPAAFSRLGNMQMLRATDNLLESLPLLPTSMLALWLDRNLIIEIPPQVGDALSLEALHLAHNKIQNLPPTLARTALRQSRGLRVEGNPLSCIPDNLRDSPDDILGFLEDVHEGMEQVLFIRVMVMGDEGAGKTSLVRCLHDPDLSLKALLRQPRLPDTGGSTLGVEAAKADTTCCALGAKVSMQFWDLAGQACYLVGHSLLMSDRVLPLYVLDSSVLEQVSIEKALKWLDTLMLALPPITDTHSPSVTSGAKAAARKRNEEGGWERGTHLAERPRRDSSATSEEGSGGEGVETGLPKFLVLPPRPSLQGRDIPEDFGVDDAFESPGVAQANDASTSAAAFAAATNASDEQFSPATKFPGKRVGSDGDGCGGEGIVSVVIICTKVEAGSCEREEAIKKMQAVSQAMEDRTKKLHGRRLCVRAMLGVSHSTRECFDARSVKDCKAHGEMNFKQVLQRIAEAALGMLYTDKQYPRALVPVAYIKLRAALVTYGAKPVVDLDFVEKLAQQHAGITAQDKLRRALAMLQCWGVLVHFGDSPQLRKTVLQARWCSGLIYTLFMCAHFASSKQEHQKTASAARSLSEMEDSLAQKVDMERLAASDPGRICQKSARYSIGRGVAKHNL